MSKIDLLSTADGPFINDEISYLSRINLAMPGAGRLSRFVAHNPSGLLWSPLEVTDETEGDATGDPENAI